MLIQGELMLPAGGRAVRLEAGWLRVRGTLIAEAGAGPPPGTPDLGSPETLVFPGFVDTHVHLPQFACIGVDGLELLDWLERAVFPAEARWADADHAGDATRRAAGRLLAHGTTAACAYATVHRGAAAAAIDALHAAGLRAMVGQVLMDQKAPTELLRPAGQLLSEAASLTGRGRVEPAVTPRFAVSCSRALLEGAGELARRTGRPIQTHMAETREECRLVEELHGARYTEVYRRAGLLTGRSLLGHGVWLDDADRAVLVRTGSVVAHCPTANLFLRSGFMDRAAHVGAGVRIGLGSDVAGGPDVSMVRVARAMIETAKVLRKEAPAAAEAWWQITAGNADAAGFGDVGRLAPGASADLVLAEPGRGAFAETGWRESPDPLAALMYGWDERWITRVIVAGGVGFERGRGA